MGKLVNGCISFRLQVIHGSGCSQLTVIADPINFKSSDNSETFPKQESQIFKAICGVVRKRTVVELDSPQKE